MLFPLSIHRSRAGPAVSLPSFCVPSSPHTTLSLSTQICACCCDTSGFLMRMSQSLSLRVVDVERKNKKGCEVVYQMARASMIILDNFAYRPKRHSSLTSAKAGPSLNVVFFRMMICPYTGTSSSMFLGRYSQTGAGLDSAKEGKKAHKEEVIERGKQR